MLGTSDGKINLGKAVNWTNRIKRLLFCSVRKYQFHLITVKMEMSIWKRENIANKRLKEKERIFF